jgi:hypothetical protein
VAGLASIWVRATGVASTTKFEMPGDGIHRRKLAHYLAKADGGTESGLDGLARLREEK